MIRVWKLTGKADFKEVGQNLFLIETLDLQKVHEGRP